MDHGPICILNSFVWTELAVLLYFTWLLPRLPGKGRDSRWQCGATKGPAHRGNPYLAY